MNQTSHPSYRPPARGFRTAVFLSCLVSLVSCLAARGQEPGDKKLTLRWFGQSFFQLETSGGKRVVFDPHAMIEFGRPAVAADVVLISHPHNDHNQVEVLENAKDKPDVYEGVKPVGKAGTRTDWNAVDKPIGAVQIRSVGLYHDALNGMQRGKNAAWVVKADGLTVVHLGDLGHLLTAEQVKAIGPVDVLLVPVGGVYTINGEQARAVVDQLKPRLYVVPMHYGVPGYDDLVGPDEFLEGLPNVRRLKTNELAIPADAKADAPAVVQLHWQKGGIPVPPKK